MMKIKVQREDGVKQVDAEIIGQLAIVDFDGTLWSVMHIETGLAIALWAHRHVALNFARKVDRLFDWRKIAFDSEYRKTHIASINNLRNHPAHRSFPKGLRRGVVIVINQPPST